MTEDATNTTTDTTTTDTTSVDPERNSVNRNSASDVEGQNEYSYMPERFMSEGQPDFEALAVSYSELEKHISQTRPTAAKEVGDYEYQPEGFELDEEMSNAFKEEALEKGLSPDQYSWIMDKYSDVINNAGPTPDGAEESLRDMWGDKYDANLDNARIAWDAFGEDLDIDVIGNNPIAIQFLSRIGAELREDNPSAGQPISSQQWMTKLEVQELMSRPDYFTNKELQKKVQEEYYAQFD